MVSGRGVLGGGSLDREGNVLAVGRPRRCETELVAASDAAHCAAEIGGEDVIVA